jgi:predicted nucleic acid-binding protein
LIIALDSNVLIYWLRLVKKPDDAAKVARSLAVVDRLLGRHGIVVPGQVLGEAYNVLVRANTPREQARSLVWSAADAFRVVGTGSDAYPAALDLATHHKLQIWDALILTIAELSGCHLLLSEDMQDGFTVGALTVANPFATALHPKIAILLDG